MAADADLIFGLIALANGLVDRAQFAVAFEAWARDTSRPLADHLSDSGSLDASGRAAIEAMVAQHFKKQVGDTECMTGAIPAGHATLESPSGLATADTEPALVDLGQAATQADEGSDRAAGYSAGSGTFTIGSTATEGQRFRVLRPHAQGGLVPSSSRSTPSCIARWRSSRSSTSRRRPDQPARFLLEAEVTGGLEHPGIVPVYGLGTYSDGRPYYAMRFIRGDRCRRRSTSFTAMRAPRRTRAARSLELRKLLRRFTGRLQCHRLCAQPRRAAPRHQAGEYHRRQARRDAGSRLGAGQARHGREPPNCRSERHCSAEDRPAESAETLPGAPWERRPT